LIPFYLPDLVRQKVLCSGFTEIHQDQGPPDIFSRADKNPVSRQDESGSLGADGHDRSYFLTRFHAFRRLVPVRANGGFPAKRQEFKVERSAVDTEPDWIHCSTICAEDAANGDPAYVPAIGADEDYPWVFSSLHFLRALFHPLKKGGKG
jgi:hypothetical protein